VLRFRIAWGLLPCHPYAFMTQFLRIGEVVHRPERARVDVWNAWRCTCTPTIRLAVVRRDSRCWPWQTRGEVKAHFRCGQPPTRHCAHSRLLISIWRHRHAWLLTAFRLRCAARNKCVTWMHYGKSRVRPPVCPLSFFSESTERSFSKVVTNTDAENI
jgi:hypothetical protein